MSFDKELYRKISTELAGSGVTLIAVSKTKTQEDIRAAYDSGQRDFGENYVQELVTKQASLPDDIRWHFIGHLQRNKVKYIAPFVHLIHGVDSMRLAREIDKQGRNSGRIIDGLIQVHIAKEETKHGFLPDEVASALSELKDFDMKNFRVKGLMGMASFTDDHEQVRAEFRILSSLYNDLKSSETGTPGMKILSMGMSGDFRIATEEGSNMVRIGSLIFGARTYDK